VEQAVPEEVTDTYVPIVDNWRPDSRAITNPDDYRISAWQTTRLGNVSSWKCVKMCLFPTQIFRYRDENKSD